MFEQSGLEQVSELRAEAAEARMLAATFLDRQTIADLQKYAFALEAQAAALDSEQRPFETCPVRMHEQPLSKSLSAGFQR